MTSPLKQYHRAPYSLDEDPLTSKAKLLRQTQGRFGLMG